VIPCEKRYIRPVGLTVNPPYPKKLGNFWNDQERLLLPLYVVSPVVKIPTNMAIYVYLTQDVVLESPEKHHVVP
jgi:hypothetical protein